MDRSLRIEFDHEITIRPAESIDDYRACQEAQRAAWGITEDNYLIPIATLVGAQHHGGLVLGAFRADGSAVAMSFAFLGRLDRRICLYSQLTGVISEFQSLGLGRRMKFLQRDYAVVEGIETIAWAFDPLQAGNARFNLDQLGATSSRFLENMYGLRTDQLNYGVPTDRLIAEWPVDPSQRSALPDFGTIELPDLIRVEVCPNQQRKPVNVNQILDVPWARLEIPSEIKTLRVDAPILADAWRNAVRNAFQAAFAAGYRAVGFYRDRGGADRPAAFYILRRETV